MPEEQKKVYRLVVGQTKQKTARFSGDFLGFSRLFEFVFVFFFFW